MIAIVAPGDNLPRMTSKPEKPPVDPELRRRVQELIAFKGGGYNEESVTDIIENALKLLTDVKDTGDVRVIQTAVRELRYAYRLFAPYSRTRKVTMFGSARTAPSKQEYQHALEFGRKMAAAGFMVITGAGPGIMQAGHEGEECLGKQQVDIDPHQPGVEIVADDLPDVGVFLRRGAHIDEEDAVGEQEHRQLERGERAERRIDQVELPSRGLCF